MKFIGRIVAVTLLIGLFVNHAIFAQSIEKSFQTPPASARPYTWWHWVNGNVSKDGITRDLEAMKAVGIGGFHQFDGGLGIPQGPVEYNSPKFHELIAFAFSEAERLGLDGGFNNASGWSSTGGPWVTPENSMKMLIWSDTIVQGAKSVKIRLAFPEIKNDRYGKRKMPDKSNFYHEVVVLAFPTPQDTTLLENWKEKALYSYDAKPNKFVPSLKQTPKNAVIQLNKVINISTRMDADGNLDWVAPAGSWTILRIGYTTTGITNRPGSKNAIGLEIDKLSRKAMDIHWENLISKIIADAKGKKSLGSILIDSYEVGMQNWTDDFNEQFIKRRGYDLLPYLVCITGRVIDNTETTERVLWDLRATAAELMQENYFGYFAEKCHNQGLKFALEPYGSGNFDASTSSMIADIPMTEFWAGGNLSSGIWAWTSQVIPSGAHLSGKSIVGAESFTAINGNYSDHPYSLKSIGDEAFARGTNRYYFHTFVHQPWNDSVKPGMSFGPYGSNFHRNNTWYPKSRAWMDYIARCQYIFQKGNYQADVLVLYGDERGFNCFLEGKEPLDIPFLSDINTDLGNINSLKDLSVDSKGDIRVTYKGRLLDTRYKILYLKRADLMLPEHVAILCELADKGARIYAPKPLRSPSLKNAEEADRTLQALSNKYWESGKIHELKELDNGLKTIVPDCKLNAGFLFNRTKIGNDDYYFISNQIKEAQEVSIQFRVSGKQPEIWNPSTGAITDAANWKVLDNGTTEVQLSMDPVGSVFVVFRKPTSLRGLSTQKPSFSQVVIDGKWTVNFDTYWGPKQPVVMDSLKPWNESSNDEIKYFSGTAVYKKEFTISKSEISTNQIFLNLGQVEIFAKVKLNGKEFETLWKPPYRIDITKIIKSGGNKLEIEVTNQWLNRLIGDERFPDYDRKNLDWLINCQAPPDDSPRKTFTIVPKTKKNDKLLSAGLIGPVVIEIATNIKP